MLFKISNKFEAAINGGIKVDIASFRLGSEFGYVPDGTEVGLRGTTVFTGSPSSVDIIDNRTMEFILLLNEESGPFQFGEVALYTSDDQFFAIATFDSLQRKSAPPQRVVNRFSIGARLILQPETIQNITYNVLSTNFASIPTIKSVEDLLPPSSQSVFNKYLTSSIDDQGNVIEAVRKNAFEWSFNTHQIRVINNGIVNAFSGVSNIVSSSLSDIENGSLSPGKYLLQITSGLLAGHTRILLSNDGGTSGASFLKPLNRPPAPGDSFVVYQSNASALSAALTAVEEAFLYSLIVKHPI